MGRHVRAWLAVLVLAGAATPAPAQGREGWRRPTAPFHIVGNVYYVGTEGLSAYLLTSSRGHVLIDGTLAENVPQVERNIARLGFRLRDVRLLLNTHAHFDHAAGLARLKRDTGARLLASAGDRLTLETGHQLAENENGLPDFPPVRVDGTLRDGAVVRQGPTALTVIATPGHTPGGTSFLTTVTERGRRLRVLFPCSLTVAGARLVEATVYRTAPDDFARSFARLERQPADVVLTAHPDIADVLGHERRRQAGNRDAFVDPGLLRRVVRQARGDYAKELARQQAGGWGKPAS